MARSVARLRNWVLPLLALLLALGTSQAFASPDGDGDYLSWVRFHPTKIVVSQSRVLRGEPFYVTITKSATLLKDLEINMSIEGEYKVVGRHGGSGEEVFLGRGSAIAGPFGKLKRDSLVDGVAHIPLEFPEHAPPGRYSLYAQPVMVRPWIFWLGVQRIVPEQGARLGEVECLSDIASPEVRLFISSQQAQQILVLAKQFPTEELAMDPDGDGLPTIAEIALGCDPRHRDSQSSGTSDLDWWVSQTSSKAIALAGQGLQQFPGKEERALLALSITCDMLSTLLETTQDWEIVAQIQQARSYLRLQCARYEFAMLSGLVRR